VKSRLLLLGSLALLVALGAAGWLALQPPRLQRQVLRGGTEVELLGVTWGRERLVVGTPLQRLFYQLLPDGHKERSGCSWAEPERA
jgi:hypothetical protein